METNQALEQRDQLIIEARNAAGNYFKEGNNCAEAIFKAFQPRLAPDMDPDLVRLVTGFGSGVGEAGCMCGALTGSIVAINMVKGRTSKEESRQEAYDYAKEFHDRFQEKFGVTCCRALNRLSFGTPEYRTKCIKITAEAADMVSDYLQEKGLLK